MHPNASPQCQAVLERIGSRTKQKQTILNLKQAMVKNDDIKYQWRLQWKKDNLTAGAMIERDPNEKDLLDYLSMYLKGEAGRAKWIVGDHQIKAGYGLNIWGGYPKQKGFETINILPRYGRGLSAYRSSHESWGFRGLGFALLTDHGQWTVSVGRNYRDGTVDKNIIHLFDDGYHDTELAISRKNKIKETTVSGMWHFQNKSMYLGLSTSYGRRNIKDFNETKKAISIFGEYNKPYGKIFSEACKTDNGTGLILGTLLRNKLISYVSSLRIYSDGYGSLRSNPMAEWAGATMGESGVYQGLRLSTKHIKVVVFGDWYSESNITPRIGYESGIRADWKRERNKIRFQWKTEEKTIEDGGNWEPNSLNSTVKRETYKIVGVTKITNKLSFRGQLIQTIAFEEKGKCVELQTIYKHRALSFWIQGIVSKIPDYTSRIYVWALNLPGEMRSRMYSDSGISLSCKTMYEKEKYRFGARTSLDYIPETKSVTHDHAIIIEVSL